MKYITFYLFSILLFSSSAIAQVEPLKIMETANEAYQQGDYTTATSSYKILLDSNYSSVDLHFNYANSLFKSGKNALAILHYEKALKINPSSADAAYNLKIANDKTVDKIERVPELFFYRWWKSVYNFFPADSWAKIMICILIGALLGFGFYKVSSNLSIRKFGFSMTVTGLILALFCGIFAASQKNYAQQSTHAIIMRSTVDILSAPSSGSSQLFVLHEGTKVKMEDKTEGWLKVSLPNGNQGWIVKKALAEI